VALLAAMLFASSAFAAPPANDDFANATVVDPSETWGLTNQTTLEATAEPGEPAHAGTTAVRSIWYSFTPTESGWNRISTCANLNGWRLAVYTGNAVNALTEVTSAGPDSVNSCPGGQNAQVEFLATAGTTYHVAVDSTSGGSQSTTLQGYHLASPGNDDFADATVLPGNASGAATGLTTRYATAEPNEPDHAGKPPVNTIWFRWTAPASGVYRWRTCSSGLSAVIALYRGTALGALTPVASGASGTDDQCGAQNAKAEFFATAGRTYRMVMDTYGTSTSAYLSLQWALIDADGDGVVDDSDQCQIVGGPAPSGCPKIARTVTLGYSKAAHAFKGRLGPAGACSAGEAVTVFKKRDGPDRQMGSDVTDADGRYAVDSARRAGTFYSRAAAKIEPSQGRCSLARSANLVLG
jgi:hypothetical protein